MLQLPVGVNVSSLRAVNHAFGKLIAQVAGDFFQAGVSGRRRLRIEGSQAYLGFGAGRIQPPNGISHLGIDLRPSLIQGAGEPDRRESASRRQFLLGHLQGCANDLAEDLPGPELARARQFDQSVHGGRVERV